MEVDETQSSGSMIPLALALLAILLGGAGLYFGLTANQQLAPIQDSVKEGNTGLAEVNKLAGSYQSRINELSSTVKELESTVARLRAYGNERDKTIKSIASALDANNRQTSKLSEQLAEVAAAQVRVPEPAPVATSANAPGSGEAAAQPVSATGSATTYAIQSGDTFGRIASSQGVSLQALLDANPDADPRRLRIGQVINIPAK